jgi:hypothetical protein
MVEPRTGGKMVVIRRFIKFSAKEQDGGRFPFSTAIHLINTLL